MSFQQSHKPKQKPKQKTGSKNFNVKIFIIASIAILLSPFILLYVLLASTLISAERSFDEQQIKQEIKNKLLISNSTAEDPIDIRAAIKQSHHEQQDESKLYKSVVPPLDAPLMDNEKWHAISSEMTKMAMTLK